jgi:hypothetical protein
MTKFLKIGGTFLGFAASLLAFMQGAEVAGVAMMVATFANMLGHLSID